MFCVFHYPLVVSKRIKEFIPNITILYIYKSKIHVTRMREIFLHLTGFEPVTFLRKRIMSPVPSTTRPQMQLVFWNWWDLNPRPIRLYQSILLQALVT